jgi:hypothetical protein
MSYVVLANEPTNEFDYQALDYCRLFSAFIESDLAGTEKVKEYLGNVNAIGLTKVSNASVLVFRELTKKDLKNINDTNRIYYFSDGTIPPSALLMSGAIECFVGFGVRSAYKIAHILRNADIDLPVRKVLPWVSTKGMRKYEAPPVGKISGDSDMSLRSMFRLMAARAVVVVPNQHPFTDLVINDWNGVISSDKLTNDALVRIGRTMSSDQANAMADRSEEMVSLLMDDDRYVASFTDIVIDGNGYDYGEPWVKIATKAGTSWVIPKQIMDGGNYVQIPAETDKRFKQMKPLELEQLLDYMAPMRFREVYVFDTIIEPVDDAKKNRILRLLRILGKRAKNIFFCMDQPTEWSPIASRLMFLPSSEGVKRVI